jgi:hypothetical protein
MLASPEMADHWNETRGDRLMLISFDGDNPNFETGWVTKQEFEESLTKLEARPFINRPRVNENKRWVAYQTIAAALSDLSETAGATKHLVPFTSDVKLDADTGEVTMGRIATALDSARIEVHPVDLIWDTRPGTTPYGLKTLSWLGKGELFGNGKTTSDAVEKIIGSYEYGCRVIVNIDVTHNPAVLAASRLNLRVLDNRFTIPPAAPVAKVPPKLTNDDRFAALIRRPYWGRGLRLESSFWPIKPIDAKTWKGLLIVRVLVPPDDKVPEAMSELSLFVSLNDGRMPLYRGLGASDIAEFQERGSYMVVFETTAKAGQRSSFASIATADLSAGATSRTTFTVPKPPKAGESASWSLIDRAGEYTGAVVLLPSLTAKVPASKPTSFMGYGCPVEQRSNLVGVVVDTSDAVVDQVDLQPLNPSALPCGWFAGATTRNLVPGTYYFKSPEGLRSTIAEPIRFEVADSAPLTKIAQAKP